MGDESFQKLVIKNLTEIRGDLAKTHANIEDIKITLETHAQLLRYADSVPRQIDLLNKNCSAHCLACRDQSSSMLSEREILEDYKMNRQNYKEGGDCGLAAAHAWEFFDRAHNLMHPKLVDGVLFAPGGSKPIMSKPNISPPEMVGISPIMRPFKLLEASGCVWVPAGSPVDIYNERGASHRVTVVTTLQGDRVVVDWGRAQFSYLPDDILLFLKDC